MTVFPDGGGRGERRPDLRLQACLNGARGAREHPALPVTPAALARDAVEVGRAGAESLRLVPRDPSGRVSLAAADVAGTLAAVRAAAPGLAIGIGLDAIGGPIIEAVRGWRVVPDFATVDLDDDGADAVVGLLSARGIGVEAAVASQGAARRYVGSRLPRYSLRVVVSVGEAGETAAVLGLLRAAGNPRPVLLHGRGARVWPAVDMAAVQGLAARAGFEDGLTLPGGVLATGNAALVACAARLLARGA